MFLTRQDEIGILLATVQVSENPPEKKVQLRQRVIRSKNRTFIASSFLPWEMSQRGDSGTKGYIARATMIDQAGIATCARLPVSANISRCLKKPLTGILQFQESCTGAMSVESQAGEL